MARKATEAELISLGEANASLELDQRQLDELIRYRDDYLARFRSEQAIALSARKALELRAFLAQLDQAIRAQQQQVGLGRKRVERQQQRWREARNKEQAIDSLLARYQADEQRLLQRREQRDSDEHTQAMWLRKRRD